MFETNTFQPSQNNLRMRQFYQGNEYGQTDPQQVLQDPYYSENGLLIDSDIHNSGINKFFTYRRICTTSNASISTYM